MNLLLSSLGNDPDSGLIACGNTQLNGWTAIGVQKAEFPAEHVKLPFATVPSPCPFTPTRGWMAEPAEVASESGGGDGGRRRTDPPTAAWRRGLTRPLSDRSALFHVPLRRLRRTCLFAPTVRKQSGQASGCVTAAGSWRWSFFAGSAHGMFCPWVGVTAVIPPLFCPQNSLDHAAAADAGQTRRLPPGKGA
jgi:hypothetical protein